MIGCDRPAGGQSIGEAFDPFAAGSSRRRAKHRQVVGGVATAKMAGSRRDRGDA